MFCFFVFFNPLILQHNLYLTIFYFVEFITMMWEEICFFFLGNLTLPVHLSIVCKDVVYKVQKQWTQPNVFFYCVLLGIVRTMKGDWLLWITALCTLLFALFNMPNFSLMYTSHKTIA